MSNDKIDNAVHAYLYGRVSLHRTDVYNPWTLHFRDRSEERDYSSYHAEIHTQYAALGSLAEVTFPLIVSVKILTGTAFLNQSFTSTTLTVVSMIVVRGMPFFVWILAPGQRRLHESLLLVSRVLNIPLALRFVPVLQALCLRTPCQLVRGIILDNLLIGILAESLIKPLRFALHVPVALMELTVATYTLSSPLGVCGALQTLAHPDSAACDATCMASALSGVPGCSTIPTTKPCPSHQQLGPLFRPLTDWTLKLMHVPSGGYLETCPALLMVGQQRCQVLGSAIQAASKLLVRAVGWLTVGTLSPHMPVGAPMEGQRVCGELALVAIVLFACVACVLYHMEACRRWQWWQARHSNRVLHPPLRTLRTLLFVQHMYVLLGVLAVASVTLLQWL